ncbi:MULTISPECIES: DUF885 domain-containing protein [Kocuria]|uniref:DUF885 domain-containing protein n=1 Tax=Kocuria subflava TaxID=1736139 RepID=A0A846TL91_9MICC|nr:MULTISPECIES: DUF885 domain-containing protein [Kocuria]NKE09968.1 DUF885 domain-containing protein [Kocuria subflava]
MSRSTGAPTPDSALVSTPQGPREASAIDQTANAHLDRLLTLNPSWAIELNAPTHGWGYPDFGPEGLEAEQDALRTTLRDLDQAQPTDDVDRVTAHALRERIGVATALYQNGWGGARINGISSPVQKIREAFDNLPKNTDDDWHVVLSQLAEVPGAVTSLISGVRHRQEHGPVTARPQLLNAAQQAENYASVDGAFMGLTHRPHVVQMPETMRRQLHSTVDAARRAYTGLAQELRAIAQAAPEGMSVGRHEYALRLQEHSGAQLDLEESYRWGAQQLRAVTEQMRLTASEILPEHAGDDHIRAAMDALDADPHRQLHGRHELISWMQGVSEHAIQSLADTHFEIPEPMQHLEARIAPTTDGGIYYTPPSEDFQRPGRMWWSVPAGTEVFRTWGERTTVYHEGVPGHHLQFATAIAAAQTLNRWRRIALWVPGHGEGWALYAERLMDDLGFLQDPGDRMGMLNAQRMRAARVVFDIGFHCDLPIPTELDPLLGQAAGARRWSPEVGWAFLKDNIVMGDASLRFEWMRYMGWPGQAPVYQLGQRVWEQQRDLWRAATAGQFSLREFHRHALSLGSPGLDTLAYALDLARPA